VPAHELARGREHENTEVGTRVDLPLAVDDHAAVGRADLRLAHVVEPPPGHGVEGHEAAAHADGLDGDDRAGEQTDEQDERERAWKWHAACPRALGGRSGATPHVPRTTVILPSGSETRNTRPQRRGTAAWSP